MDVVREALNKPFDKLRTNGNFLIPFVVSPSINSGEPSRTMCEAHLIRVSLDHTKIGDRTYVW
jgi:hypothetical protein